MRHWECEHASDSVCAAVVSVSSAVSFFADGITAGGYTPRPGAAFRPGHSTLAQWYTSGWTVGEVEESRKEHDAAVTHMQCQRAQTCQRAARASLVHVRH